MNDRILVPYDGSEQSNDALEHALESFPGSEVVLLHVIEPYAGTADRSGLAASDFDRRQANAEQLLETAVSDTDSAARIESAITVGRPIHEVLKVTDDEGIDQIVIGSHGRDGAARLLLGSVAETVVRRAPVPVTVVRHDQQRTGEPETVLVPFDGSTAARHALEHALHSFETADVTALFVLYPPSSTTNPSVDDDVTGTLEEWDETRHAHAQTVLSTAEDVASDHGREVQTAETGGEPADAILEYIEAHDSGHVVIGSTGRDGLARLLLGSVAETVVRRSPVCVTVAK